MLQSINNNNPTGSFISYDCPAPKSSAKGPVTIYRIQFPVTRQFEAHTWYDQRGRIIFTNSKDLPGVGLIHAAWNEVKHLQSGTVTQTKQDTTLPTGPVERLIEYYAPFTKSDRESDYATVWRKLETR